MGGKGTGHHIILYSANWLRTTGLDHHFFLNPFNVLNFYSLHRCYFFNKCFLVLKNISFIHVLNAKNVPNNLFSNLLQNLKPEKVRNHRCQKTDRRRWIQQTNWKKIEVGWFTSNRKTFKRKLSWQKSDYFKAYKYLRRSI